MSQKHGDPEYRKNARILRQQVEQRRRRDEDVTCWRCGRPIHREQTFDVGHIDAASGHGLNNLAPEHRYKSGVCQGNRAAGGRMGQAIQAARRPAAKGLLPW